MAVLSGILAGAAIQAANPGASNDLASGVAPVGGAWIPSSPLSGALASPGASPEPKISLTGAEAFATHLWDRVVVIPDAKALGLVGSEQTFDVEIWNTYRSTQWRITAATVTGAGGLTLSGVALPASLAPLGSKAFSATVPEAGSATISNIATFSVAQDRAGGSVQFSPSLTVTGLRINPFPFDPDWSPGITETIEYMTQILTARSGAEQRYKLRAKPRRSLEIQVMAIGADESQPLDALLWKRQPEVFAVPWWQDGVQFVGTLAQGAQTIAVDTSDRLFSLAPMVMIWQDAKTCEIQTIQSVSAGLITCNPTSRAYTNPLILPAFPGRMPPDQEFDATTSVLAEGSVRFACEVGVNDPRPSPAPLPQTYGYDVLEVEPNWDRAPRRKARRKLSIYDYKIGPVVVRDRGAVSFQSQTFDWFLDGRDQIQAFRDFFDRRCGKLVPFWFPTWRDDLTLAQPALAGSSGIVVNGIGYTTRMFPDLARRYLAIRNPSGGWIYRKVTSASEGSGIETLGLDSAVGVALPAGTTISFLTLCRMDSDAADIAWITTEFAEASSTFLEIPKEVPA